MTISELLARREGVDFEAKAAQGRDGSGAVPNSLWETYSALANTDGGEIVLGVEEKADGSLVPIGIGEPNRIISDIWNQLNNSQKVNVNILGSADVQKVEEGGLTVVRIAVPRAPRRRRPVFIGRNPFGGTYRRAHDGDYRCADDEVKRMIADAEHDTLDSRILRGYTIDDLDADSLASFRNEFRSAIPNHVWHTYDDLGLLEQLGGWRRDRETGESGFTLAGLLMFGRLRPILDALPHYVLDYRTVSAGQPGIRWSDRVTTDGTWSGNLYGFYRRAYDRLTEGLSIPFRTDQGRRIDETPVHRALKEALVNALIHADYSGTTPILVQRDRSGFSFRNPGTLRLPREKVRAGGTSDCRNRNLQKMFQMIGSAEQAGSGFPTILGAWKEQLWRPPSLMEDAELEHVSLTLSTASLLPAEVLERLAFRFGEAFIQLDEHSRIAMTTAAVEGRVSNGRLQELFDLHPAAITQLLGTLVGLGMLETHSARRWTYYTLPPSDQNQGAFDFRGISQNGDNSAGSGGSTAESGDNSAGSGGNTAESDDRFARAEELQALGKEPLPDIEHLLAYHEQLPSWAPADTVEAALLDLLRWAREHDAYLTSAQLGWILGRSARTVLEYLKPFAASGAVETLYPGRRAPSQGYRAAEGI